MRERRAYVCRHQDHVKANMAWRQFLMEGEPVPECPQHKLKLERQPNRPYNGKPVPTTPAAVRKGAKKS